MHLADTIPFSWLTWRSNFPTIFGIFLSFFLVTVKFNENVERRKHVV